jgi:beta-lactamase superfamily II metal-dependent hydrolase
MKRAITFCCLLCISAASYADYLKTTRKTSIKQEPSSQSAAIIQVPEGTELELLDSGRQTNGYYRVASNLFAGPGWIYRTFVRRYADDGTGPSAGTSTTPSSSSTSPLPDATGTVRVRVVDVGAGLCNLIHLPTNQYIIYDAGHWRGTSGSVTLNQIKEFIPEQSTIELMILSHNDSDHIGAAAAILEAYKVKKVLWTGYSASMASGTNSGTFDKWVDALAAHPEVVDINLHECDSTIVPGTELTFGNVTVTFLCGFGKPLSNWDVTDKAEKMNSVSIVMKLQYKTNSVLFSGDAVGRHRDAPANALIATEEYLVNNAAQLLRSNIVIAPHHGADNGSSNDFITHVSPETVIFSAGHSSNWSHPRESTANRYIQHGVQPVNMLRTDRGDDEGGNEWSHTRIGGCIDTYGDDDIQIDLREDGTYSAYYLHMTDPCEQNY